MDTSLKSPGFGDNPQSVPGPSIRWMGMLPLINNDITWRESITIFGPMLIFVYFFIFLIASSIYGFDLFIELILLLCVALLVMVIWILLVFVTVVSDMNDRSRWNAEFFIGEGGAGYTTEFRFIDTGLSEFQDIPKKNTRLIKWKDVRRIKVDDDKRVIRIFSKSIFMTVTLYCLEDNFDKALGTLHYYGTNIDEKFL